VTVRVLLAGGGHSHVEVLRRMAGAREPGLEATLVSPDPYTAYSGMLPGLLAGHYAFEEAHIHLPPLARAAGVRFVESRIVALDVDAKVALLESGDSMRFDVVSLDVGSTPDLALPGVREHAIGVKPVERLLAGWDAVRRDARAGEVRSIAVVGGGAGGVEVVLSMQHRLASEMEDRAPRWTLITDLPYLLPQHAGGVRSRLASVLRERGIVVHLGSAAVAVEPGEVVIEGGDRIAADRVFWATAPKPAAWLAASGLATDEEGFVQVNDHLQSTSHPFAFATGDCASQEGRSHPRSGLYAVRHGPPLTENLRRFVRGEALARYVPQNLGLSLVGIGGCEAVLSYGPIAIQGIWVWRWKQSIDRRFVARYRVDAAGALQ
jgi:selenide,water dikinase